MLRRGQLKKIVSNNSITVAFWNDYGESISKISETLVLGNGNNHYESDYIFSKILLSSSSEEVKELMESAVLKSIGIKTEIGDLYLYLPYRILDNFSTSKTTNLSNKRKAEVYTTRISSNSNGIISLDNKMIFDSKNGNIDLGAPLKIPQTPLSQGS